MGKKIVRVCVWSVVLMLCSFSQSYAQKGSRSDLEKRRAHLINEIKEAQNQLKVTKKDKNANMSQLRALQSKLAMRQKLISNINDQMGQLDRNIKNSAGEVKQLSNKLSDLKTRYAQSVRFSYANRHSSSILAFLFSSSSYNDAIRRLKYIRRLRDFRRGQVDDIRNTQVVIEKKISQLNVAKSQKEVLRIAEERQKQIIENETQEKNSVVLSLKGKEKDLLRTISKNQKSARQLKNAISKIIQKEIEIARKKALEEARKKAEAEKQRLALEKKKQEEAKRLAAQQAAGDDQKTFGTGANAVRLNTGSERDIASVTKPPADKPKTTSTPTKPPAENLSYKMMLTPEATALSNSFENNKGKLPWPLERGIIVGSFGIHKHAVAEKVMVENDGIDIQTGPSAPVRCVYKGVVKSVFSVPGRGQVVLVSHGLYFTVYSQLASVNVKKDQAVDTKQIIGTVGTNDDGLSVLNFQVWKVSANNGSSKMNPETWIAR